MLNEEGRLVIDSSDFCDSNLGCFQSYLRISFDEVIVVSCNCWRFISMTELYCRSMVPFLRERVSFFDLADG